MATFTAPNWTKKTDDHGWTTHVRDQIRIDEAPSGKASCYGRGIWTEHANVNAAKKAARKLLTLPFPA